MKKWLITCVTVWVLLTSGAFAQDVLQVPSDKPRIVISTDLGGGDEDDIQSLIHYLMYADRFVTEGIISSPPGAGRASDILRVLDVYAKDWQWIRGYSEFPKPPEMRELVKQGAVAPSPKSGYSARSQGSEWIIRCARSDDSTPLWVLVWGSITDVAQALHDAPDIKANLRVHFIGSWNLRKDPHAFAYIEREHSDLFLIHNDSTFRGWYRGGDQSGDLGNRAFVERHVAGHGVLGDLFASCHAGGVAAGTIKMGDTPTVAYLLRGDRDDPTLPHWGGRFVRHPNRPNWFIDDPDSAVAEAPHGGAKTVSRWRADFLQDWKQRMDWCIPPATRVNWRTIAANGDDWFGSDDSHMVASYVLSHQTPQGGWSKNRGTFQYLYHGDTELEDTTFDNGATAGEIRFLARMAAETGNVTYRSAALRGIDYVLRAQDKRTGGWPQRYPIEDNYSSHITYNDNATVNLLSLVRDITQRHAPFSAVVDEVRRQACAESLSRGVRCLLDSQVIQRGNLTTWCAQHHRSTLLPAKARSYEHPSLSGGESADILRFLMSLPSPSADVVAAVHAGASWFFENQIKGMRVARDPGNGDKELVPDPGAAPIWARFYELGTNRPIFSGRDGIIRYGFEQVEPERRRNYAWFSRRGTGMLSQYEIWRTRYPMEKDQPAHFLRDARPLRPGGPAVLDWEIAVRNYSHVANVGRAMRIDYPANPAGTAPPPYNVILCPGGDFRHLRIQDAHRHATALAKRGLPTTVLKYRTPHRLDGAFNSEVCPLDDLVELVQQIRSERPNEKIAIVGTQAGGHLALMAAVHHRLFGRDVGPDVVAVADAPAGTPPQPWLEALLLNNADDRNLRDFLSANLHGTEDMCPAHFSFDNGSQHRADAEEFVDRLQGIGVPVSISEDRPSDPRLPHAFHQLFAP